MGFDPVSVAVASLALGAVSAGASYIQSEKSASQQKSAAKKAEQTAKDTASQQEQAINRQNKKYADVAGLLSENQQAALSGQSGTSLTGSQGVDPNSLLLGKKGLLGG